MDMMGEEEYSFYLETLFFEKQELDLYSLPLLGEEHSFYLETTLFEKHELDRLGFEEVTINPSDSSSPEGTPSSSTPIPRNIVMERRRRQRVSDKLKALRSAVPIITKMDKASIIKDAIDYIQVLHEQEKRMSEEIKELERALITDNNKRGMPVIGADRITLLQDDQVVLVNESKKKRTAKSSVVASGSPGYSSIGVMEVEVCQIADRTFAVSIICNKKRQTMTNVCELFESLNLKVIKASITSICRSLLHTLLVESEELSSTQLKEMVKGGIAELNAEGSQSHMMN